ncbi:hypothetical protein [Ekhidna sp.]|jgi:hypothetical protein|uniref:hypothetical protein n=1 Tax=Ekhidna sp. TaxID=2608089 RepID=UPI0032EE3312
MKNLFFIVILVLTSGLLDAQANDPEDGYAIVRSDTIYGKVKINFDSGSILIQQDSINRMFLSDIEQVTLLNKQRETFIPIYEEGNTTFYKVLVAGDYPLLEAGELHFTLVEGNVIQISEDKDLYDIFGKRDVKDYLFLRNIQIADKSGLVDVFRYFNKHESF